MVHCTTALPPRHQHAHRAWAMLLMACLMKFGSLPVAADPASPTEAEMKATRTALDAYQHVFNTH